MAVGQSTTGTVPNSIDVMVASARQIREHRGVMPQIVDKETLETGTGTDWREVAFERLADATSIGEGFAYRNDQQITDALLSGTPVVVGISVVWTKRMKARMNAKAYAQIGGLTGNAIQRKKAKDGITQLDSFSTSFGGAGTTLGIGYVDAAVAQIEGNATEPGEPPFYGVFHRHQIRDFNADLAPSGTYPIPSGISAEVISNGFGGRTLSGVQIFADSVVAPDSGGDFKGGVFAKNAIVLVQGHSLITEELKGEEMTRKQTEGHLMLDEYIYIERQDANGIEMYFDATAPTS